MKNESNNLSPIKSDSNKSSEIYALRCEKHKDKEGTHYCFGCNSIICVDCKEVHKKKRVLIEKIKKAAVDLMKDLINPENGTMNEQDNFIETEGRKLRGFIKKMDKEVLSAFQECCGRMQENKGKITNKVKSKMNELNIKGKYNELIVLCVGLKNESEKTKNEPETLNEGKLRKLNEMIADSINKFKDEWQKISDEIENKANNYKNTEEIKETKNDHEEIEKSLANVQKPLQEIPKPPIKNRIEIKYNKPNKVDGILIKEESNIEPENDEFRNVLYSFYPKSDKCLLYDIVTKIFKVTLFPQNTDIYCGGSCKIKNIIFTAGGWNDKSASIKVCASYEILKDLSLVRKDLCPLNESVCYNALVNVDNHVIFSMGGNFSSVCEKYEISKNEWKKSKPLNEGKGLITPIVLQNRYIYCVGGSNTIKYGIEKLDTETESSWEIITFTKEFPFDSVNNSYHYNPVAKINDNEYIIFGSKGNIKINFSTQTITELIKYTLIAEYDNQNEIIFKNNYIYSIFKDHQKLERFNISTNQYEDPIPIKF